MQYIIIKSIEYFFLTYGIILFIIYFGFILLASKAISKNKKTATFLNINDIKGAEDLPSVTLVAPAYNEGKTILVNVNSLLSIEYPYYSLIVVNDGSTDDSLPKLIQTFDLEEIPLYQGASEIKHIPAKKIYKSTNVKYKNLTIIDKDNGGRADALNCGIAYAQTNLVLCTDADCIIEQNALLKMVRPYLEELDKEVIASGGAIGIVNNSVIKNGILKEVKLPKSIIARIQVVEYIRAFLLGRMAWGHVDGLMLVSGAFGMYPRRRLLEVGGFDPDTVGEDLELCIRLRSHMEKLKAPYEVIYIPEVLCWTEAPSTPKIFITQRDRWARGLFEVIKKHRKLFLNRKYNKVGTVFFPYWVFFEFAAPIVEFLGLIYIVLYLIFGAINWPIAIALAICVYLLGCIFSTIAILMFTKNFKHYSKPSVVVRLVIASYLEPFINHPLLLYGQIKGYLKKIFKVKTTWGTMTRKGF